MPPTPRPAVPAFATGTPRDRSRGDPAAPRARCRAPAVGVAGGVRGVRDAGGMRAIARAPRPAGGVGPRRAGQA